MKPRHTLPVLLLVFAILAAGIVAAGCLLYRSQQDSCRTKAEHALTAIADLKVSELLAWRKERLADAKLFYRNYAFSALVRRSIERPQDVPLQEELRSWISHVQASGCYDRVALFDAAGNTLMMVSNTGEPLSPVTRRKAREALSSGRLTLSDFYRNEYTQNAYLRIFVPILDGPSGRRLLGILMLRIDPRVYLYPLIQRWPTPSATAETLLIRREGSETVVLNELEFQKNAALARRVSMERTDRLPEQAKAPRGQEGFAEGVDYRGMPALGVLRAIPDSPWHLVARIDAAEVYAPMREWFWMTVLFVASLLFGVAAVVGFIWRQRHAALYWEKYEVEQKYRSLFEGSRDALMILEHPSWKFSFCNPATVAMFRLRNARTLMALGPWELSPEQQPDGRKSGEKAKEMIETAVREGSHFFEWRHKRIDGEEFPATILLTRVEFAGKVVIQATVRDITALKKAEAALRESEEKHRLILDHTSDLIWCLSPEGVFTYVSSSWKRVTGYEPSSILDTAFRPLVHPDDIPACLSHLSKAIETKQITQSPEFRFRHADGSWHWHVATGTPALGPGGEVISVVGVSREITERKQAEEELRESKQRLDLALEGAEMGAWHWNVAGDNRYFSDQTCFLLGIDPSTFRGTADEFFAVMPPEDRAAVKAALRRTLDHDMPYESDYRTTWPDGSVHCIRARGKLSRDNAGRPLKLSGVVWDVTTRKRAEEDLLHTKAELQQYAAALEASNHALEEFNRLAESANRAKSEFLANMSHEIRTPMTAILGYADLMLEENAGRATQAHVEVIKHNGEHLLRLLNDILDLSKVEAGKMRIEPTRCSPCELAAEIALLMRVRADAKHLKLKTELAGPLPETVLTDPLRLRQVLVNLVGNAIKFTDQGEVRITVRFTSNGGPPRLRFDVIDTGIGMSEEQVGRIFQPFSQADNSPARKFGGTGLGLCISKRLTEALGGNIEVRSEPGKGSTFSVILDPGPLDGIRMIQNAQEALLDRSPTTTAATPDKVELHGRVLLAEDGPDNQRLICTLLTKAGAHVVAVENGQLAVEAALAACDAGQSFDAILMDMQMPVMDGYAATRRLRALGYTGPIIALTAHSMVEDRQKCLAVGCDDYATKPIDRGRLIRTIAAYVGKQPIVDGATPAPLQDASARNDGAIVSH